MAEGVRVLKRVFDIMDYLARSSKAPGLTEIAQATGMSKSTAHRLLAALRENQYVERQEDNTYRIGMQFLNIASYHLNSLELLTESFSPLDTLRRQLHLTVHIGRLEQGEVVYLALQGSPAGSRLQAHVGTRAPAHCSAIGKCLLACLSKTALEVALDQCSFTSCAAKTFTDRHLLREALHAVRRQGFAISDEEQVDGYRGIAAPVLDYRGEAVAAVGVTGTLEQMPPSRWPAIAQRVCQRAGEVSRKMGYNGTIIGE